MGAEIEVYAWPEQVAFCRGVQTRPDGDWAEVDDAIIAACAACPLELRVLLVPDEAENAARDIYVSYEPLLDAVIAIGHRDRSVQWGLSRDLIPRNEKTLAALLADARRELGRGSTTAALLAIARHVPELR